MAVANTPNQPQIAVIGSGYWGKNLVRNYANLGALKLICDKNETILEGFRQQYQVDTCLALNDVLVKKNIQGVVIATPAETHFRIAREALLAEKHVYVEKPLVLKEDEADELIKIAQDKKLTLMVGHLLQYHPIFAHLKQLVTSGDLGRINYIYSNRLNLGKIRREDNILWSFAPHDISMILSLAGENPETVSATGGNYLHQKIADVTTTHLKFPSGMRSHIFVSWLHPFKEQKLVVVGDKKMAVFDDTLPWPDKLLLYPHEINWQGNLPVPSKKEAERVSVPEAEPLRLECEQFLSCISNGNSPITDGKEGLDVLKILNAAQKSMDLGGAEVYLDGNGQYTANLEVTPPKNERDESQANFFHHPSVEIDPNVEVGKGTKIWHFSHVLSNSTIGKNCNIGQNVVIGPDVKIGNNCKIQNNVSVYKGVTLENGVFCGPSMVFTNIVNPRAEISKMNQVRPTLVKKGATIGANATIICGVTIGEYAFVGAGAVVTKDVPANALVVGNPARQIGNVCQCGEKLSDDMFCRICNHKVKL